VEGSIWGGTGRDGGSTELRRRPAMVAANVASLMVLGNGGWVVEGQREVENVVGCLDCRMGRRREELGVQGCRRLQWQAADGEMGSGRARGLGARFIGAWVSLGAGLPPLGGNAELGEYGTGAAGRRRLSELARARGELGWCQGEAA